jgi:hypothetical protein
MVSWCEPNLIYDISDRHDARKLFPMAGMQELFTRPWWSRVWVLQELVVSRKAEFACGKERLAREHCAAAFGAFMAYREVLFTAQVRRNIKLTAYEERVASVAFVPRPKQMLG